MLLLSANFRFKLIQKQMLTIHKERKDSHSCGLYRPPQLHRIIHPVFLLRNLQSSRFVLPEEGNPTSLIIIIIIISWVIPPTHYIPSKWSANWTIAILINLYQLSWILHCCVTYCSLHSFSAHPYYPLLNPILHSHIDLWLRSPPISRSSWALDDRPGRVSKNPQ